MSSNFDYKVFAAYFDKPTYVKKEGSIGCYFLFILLLAVFALFSFALNTNGGIALGIVLIIFLIGVIISAVNYTAENQNRMTQVNSERIIAESKQLRSNQEADFYSQKLNILLIKSNEIVTDILPYYKSIARKNIDIAKADFNEQAFSPFWSKIEDASNALACFKDALTQLCANSEIYTNTLKHLKHNFPIPFPFAVNIQISQTIEDYKVLTRKAHTQPTFSIIWEQRRNTQVLAGGFKTLENAIFNLSADISEAVTDLTNSIKSDLEDVKYFQIQQIETLENCGATLNQGLNYMDTKLYYIQWKKKPLENFRHR